MLPGGLKPPDLYLVVAGPQTLLGHRKTNGLFSVISVSLWQTAFKTKITAYAVILVFVENLFLRQRLCPSP